MLEISILGGGFLEKNLKMTGRIYIFKEHLTWNLGKEVFIKVAES